MPSVTNKMAANTVTYHYWGSVRSRNMYAGYIMAGANLTDKMDCHTDYPYPGTPEWEVASPKSAWGQLPVLTDTETGATIGESGAIHRYLIKKFGLEPAGLKEYGFMNQSLESASAIHGALGKAHYGAVRKDAMDATFTVGTGSVMKVFAGAEQNFEDGSVFACAEASPGDYALAAGLQLCVDLQADCLDTFPKLKALHEHVSGMETIKAYNASHAYPYFKRE